MSNCFPFSIGSSFLTSGTTVVFTEEAVRAFVRRKDLPAQQTVSWSPQQRNALLKNLRSNVYAFGSNHLKTHEFYRVKLENDGGTETGYVCVWAASGSAPSTLA